MHGRTLLCADMHPFIDTVVHLCADMHPPYRIPWGVAPLRRHLSLRAVPMRRVFPEDRHGTGRMFPRKTPEESEDAVQTGENCAESGPLNPTKRAEKCRKVQK